MKPPSKRKAQTSTSTAAPKRQEQPARKRRTPTPSESDSESDTQSDICNEEDHNEEDNIEEVYNEEVHHEDVRNNDDTIRNEGQKSTPKVTPILNESVPSPPPSSTTTIVQINISPCPPPISTRPQATIPLSIPIFTESTPPSNISATHAVSVNISDAGAGISGFTTTHVSPHYFPFSY